MSKQKTRFDGLDVLAMTSQLQRQLLGFKLVNIYDGSSGNNVLLFKLASTGTTTNTNTNASSTVEATAIAAADSSSNNKKMLLMESGIRFHISAHESSNQKQPGQFAMKLRKHIRGSRLEGIRQLGSLDRVVDFRFGSGERAHHVILELYASGNIILTDSKYEILALLRTHDYDANVSRSRQDKDGSEDNQRVRVAVREIYPVTYATSMSTCINASDEQIDDSSESKGTAAIYDMDVEAFRQWLKSEINVYEANIIAQQQQQQQQTKKKKKSDKSSLSLKTLILKQSSGVQYYGPSLIEHCILCAGLDPIRSLTLTNDIDDTELRALLECIKNEAPSKLDSLRNNISNDGFVLYKQKGRSPVDRKRVNTSRHSDKMFCEFQPHLLKQHHDVPHLPYSSFSEAVDDFFSLIEGQKSIQKAETIEKSAKDRLNKIRQDQEKRVEGLRKEQEKMQLQAKFVELYASDVDNALLVINSALDSGMDWDDLGKLVEYETNVNENPIAMIISKLDFKNDAITLSLPDPDNENEHGNPSSFDVTVSRLLSAHANAREMFTRHRNAKEKAEKTIEASLKALKAAEAAALKQVHESQSRREKITSVSRTVFWFEKFNWCITSDNYLVIGGRDAQQNEAIVKRYLRPGDAYLHADVHGAASCILRAKRRRKSNGETQVLPLPDAALREAGTFTICRSSAWSSKMVTSAWWVESHQVSKTAPTGEYLTVGSFMIRGRKNFLPPSHLEMGLAVLFRLGDETSIARHSVDRRDFSLMNPFESDDYDKDENETLRYENDSFNDFDEIQSTTKLEPFDESTTKEDGRDTRNDELKSPTDSDKDFLSPNTTLKQKTGDNELEEETNVEIEAEKSIETVTTPRQKKGLSARDRKLIKKYGSLEAAEEATTEREKEKIEIQKKKALKNASKQAILENSRPVKAVRGKKGKKKRASKYADQDDEDKELALFVLQGRSDKKINKKKGSQIFQPKNKTQVEAANAATALLVKNTEEIAKKFNDQVQNILGSCVTTHDGEDREGNIRAIVNWNKFDGEVLEQLLTLSPLDAQVAAANRLLQLTQTTRIDNFAASLSGIIRKIQTYGYEDLCNDVAVSHGEGKQRKTKLEKEAEKEAWQALLAEDGVIEGEGDDDMDKAPDDTPELLKLTGKPMSEDSLLFAVPVCAPYQSLSQYKYRIKLTPGSQKRGKASKQCLDMLLTFAKDAMTERDLIKLVGDNEWVQSICGDVKISAPGASKVAKKQKQSSKKSKKK